jgi:hypothetical protein
MAIFKKQSIICCICGNEFKTDFNYCGGYVCCQACKDEYEWRKTLYIMGKDYTPNNK